MAIRNLDELAYLTPRFALAAIIYEGKLSRIGESKRTAPE
jgi:hypothetical protein